jgi:hypothetical protein
LTCGDPLDVQATISRKIMSFNALQSTGAFGTRLAFSMGNNKTSMGCGGRPSPGNPGALQ